MAELSSILVLGDLHIAGPGRWQPWRSFLTAGRQLEEVCEEIGDILGALPGTLICTGDSGSMSTYEALQTRFAKVHAVAGNADDSLLRACLPGHEELTVAGARLLLVHGWGSPRYIVDRIARRYGWDWDGIVFGHTHRPLAALFEDTLCMNPGSPTDIRIAKQRTFGLLAAADCTFPAPERILGKNTHRGISFAVYGLGDIGALE